MLSALRILLRNTVDAFVDYAIAAKLKAVLSVGRVAYICKLLEGIVLKCVSKVLGHSLKASSAHICPRTFETHLIIGAL